MAPSRLVRLDEDVDDGRASETLPYLLDRTPYPSLDTAMIVLASMFTRPPFWVVGPPLAEAHPSKAELRGHVDPVVCGRLRADAMLAVQLPVPGLSLGPRHWALLGPPWWERPLGR